MKTESIDTNVLLRAAMDVHDGQTAPARALLADSERLFSVSLVAIAECMHAMIRHYEVTRPDAIAALRHVLRVESIVCPRDVVLPALDIFESHPKLSFEDCLMAEQASISDATPLWTFDTKLAKQHPAARLVV